MEADGSKNCENSDSVIIFKADLKEKLMELVEHPGTPSEDKEKLFMIINKLEE